LRILGQGRVEEQGSRTADRGLSRASYQLAGEKKFIFFFLKSAVMNVMV